MEPNRRADGEHVSNISMFKSLCYSFSSIFVSIANKLLPFLFALKHYLRLYLIFFLHVKHAGFFHFNWNQINHLNNQNFFFLVATKQCCRFWSARTRSMLPISSSNYSTLSIFFFYFKRIRKRMLK